MNDNPNRDERAASLSRFVSIALEQGGARTQDPELGLLALARAAAMMLGCMSPADRMRCTSEFKRQIDASTREVLEHVTGKPALAVPSLALVR